MLRPCRKVHLFDIDIPGKITFKESLTLTPGQGPTVVDTPAGRLGVGICYDMRFPELAALYAARGVQLIVYPGECTILLTQYLRCTTRCSMRVSTPASRAPTFHNCMHWSQASGTSFSHPLHLNYSFFIRMSLSLSLA